ncbi:MAG: DnaJ domain-containing protein [Methanobrevibacter sp.]|nr:DnaJ domain-containing protein [Methanobrevibacter sp.]
MYVKQEYYDILNSSRTDSLDKIKENYKSLCLKYHPDVGGSEEHFKKINIAMDIIWEFHNDSDNRERHANNKTNNDDYKAKQKTKKTDKQYTNKTKNKSTNYKNKNKNTYKSKNNKEKNNIHKCPKCGFHDPDAFNYCINCGYRFNSINKKIILLFIVGIFLFYGVSKILALIYFIWLYKHYK